MTDDVSSTDKVVGLDNVNNGNNDDEIIVGTIIEADATDDLVDDTVDDDNVSADVTDADHSGAVPLESS